MLNTAFVFICINCIFNPLKSFCNMMIFKAKSIKYVFLVKVTYFVLI